MSKKYYAVEFWSGRNTTAGSPNERTGRMSKACDIWAFSSKAARDSWVDAGKITSDMQGNCRKAVAKKEARSLCLGISVGEFDAHLDMTLDGAEI